MKNKFTILGCGSSLGAPWITGYKGNLKNNLKNIRTRCCAHIKYKNLSILIDTSPDIKNQIQKNKIKDIDAVMYTHEHADQTVGIPTNNFKQEPKDNAAIKKFCEANFGVNFPMTEKMDVIGANAHPFFKWAKKNYGIGAIPKWNFHKIVIGKDGKIADTFASFTKPNSKKFLTVIDKEIKS